MPTHTRQRSISKLTVGNTKSPRRVNDFARGTIMAKALLNAFQFSKRKVCDTNGSGKTQQASGGGIELAQSVNQFKSLQENSSSKLSGTFDINAVLSKVAGFPINISCLSAFGDISAPAIVELLRAASFTKSALKVFFIEKAKLLITLPTSWRAPPPHIVTASMGANWYSIVWVAETLLAK